MSIQPTHGELAQKLDELHDLLKPIVEDWPEVKQMIDGYRAAKVGGSFFKWLAGVGTALLAIWLFAREVVHALGSGTQ